MNPKDRLKEVREVMKLTQLDFGMPLGLSQANIRDIESGKVKFSTLHALAIEKVYEISSEWLLTGLGPKKVGGHSEDKNECDIEYDKNPINVKTVANDKHEDYGDPIAQAFLKDWLNLSDVVKMRVWTLVKEELERQGKKEGV